jgi:hypothetical protein
MSKLGARGKNECVRESEWKFIALLICINTKDDFKQGKLIQLANLMLTRFVLVFIPHSFTRLWLRIHVCRAMTLRKAP